MWHFHSEDLISGDGLRFVVERKGKPATFVDVLQGWQEDASLRTKFNTQLAESPYSAFRWETPCVTAENLKRPFECVLLNRPGLVRHPNPSPFAAQFNRTSQDDVLVFPNLGGDAIMIVPRQKTEASAYGHLAAFVRKAPETQQHTLWQLVGKTMLQRISAKPVWLSTAGGGVSWLHVRLDDRPKYYGYASYRQLL